MTKQPLYTLSVYDDGEDIQLVIQENPGRHSTYLLGTSEFPFKKTIKQWHLSKNDLKNLIENLEYISKQNK